MVIIHFHNRFFMVFLVYDCIVPFFELKIKSVLSCKVLLHKFTRQAFHLEGKALDSCNVLISHGTWNQLSKNQKKIIKNNLKTAT